MCDKGRGMSTGSKDTCREWALWVGPDNAEATRQVVLARDGQRHPADNNRVPTVQELRAKTPECALTAHLMTDAL